IYNEKPTVSEFLDEWLSLIKSGSGERGIFNRSTLLEQLPERRRESFANHLATCGTNPCGEIILRSKQFCNLSEVVARAEDTPETLLRKIRLATILGTYQSTLTNFPYLSPEWKKNCEEERLLGVSITGQWDSPAVRNPETLRALKAEAIKVNEEYAKRFGINASTCVTCVKPSGTVSQLVDASSGMHPRHAPYYIRRIRISATDPLFKMLKDQKFPYKPEVGQTESDATTYVLEFPVKAPDGAIYRDDLSAIEQLEYWKQVKVNFTEHNPSVTVSVSDDEWLEVGNWLYKNWEIIGGLSFLPRTNHVYALAPYEAISKEKYEQLANALPKIDFAEIVCYEETDETQGAKELACVAGSCEL
ncbi:MAG: ribonucleoside-triphosphate reductase, partial [Chloroherpetonaceae bacterium]